nr:hypothetical protein [Tanacetum cinerariifolium]
MYDSWKSRIDIYMMNRQHRRIILESVENGPPLWPTIEENRVTRPKKHSELSATEAIQADCDVKATNIILQGLPPEYGSHTQSSTPLLITYPPNDFQSSFHHNVYNPSSSIPQVEYAPSVNQQSDFSQPDSGLIVPVFQRGDDPIDAINHMTSFLTAVVTSRYPPSNNQLRNSSNPRQQATINNGRVTVQPIQGRHTSLAAGTSRTYTSGASGNNSRKQKTVVCYNCKGEGHMSKQCSKPKRKRDESWFKDKVLLVQTQANKQILHEEELAFWAVTRIAEAQTTQNVITRNVAYQANDLDAYDSNCDEINNAKVTHLANLSHYGSNDLVESQEKDIVIKKLKERIKSLSGNIKEEKIKHELEEIETINIELDHRHTQEETATLREIVEHERSLNPLNNSLDYACKYTKQIQELLIVLKQTCPCINDLGDKLMAVTPMNKTKKVRFTEPVTSSRNKPIKTLSSSNIVSNKPMLSSTGVTLPTSASGLQPSVNTKKDKIQQTPSSAKKNKLEAYPRNVRTSLQNKKSIVNTKNIASVQESKLNVNYDLQCFTYNGCLFFDNHDSCVLEFINSVNARVNSKSAKKPLKRKV